MDESHRQSYLHHMNLQQCLYQVLHLNLEVVVVAPSAPNSRATDIKKTEHCFGTALHSTRSALTLFVVVSKLALVWHALYTMVAITKSSLR
jgi:hypothetical protein